MDTVEKLLKEEREWLLKEYAALKELQQLLQERNNHIKSLNDPKAIKIVNKYYLRLCKAIFRGGIFRRGLGWTEKRACAFHEQLLQWLKLHGVRIFD